MRRRRGLRNKCYKNGKRQHDTFEEARAEAKFIRKKFGPKVHAYECPHCHYFHIGHNRRRPKSEK